MEEPQLSPETPQEAAVEAAPAKPKRKPRKPRAPRKKKTAEAAPAEPIILPPVAQVKAPVEPVVPAPAPVIPASELPAPENGHAYRLKVRRDGRKALDINLGGEGHTWERLVSGDDKTIYFRFKDEPDGQQAALIEKFGFLYDRDRKEASRPNDPTGRLQADRLSWYLREMQREQHAQAASR